MSRLPVPPPTSSAPAETIGQLIRERTVTVRALLERADWLHGIEATLHTGFDAPWAAGLRVANIRGGTLVLYADNAAAALRARLSTQNILKLVNQHHELRCAAVEIKTRPAPPSS